MIVSQITLDARIARAMKSLSKIKKIGVGHTLGGLYREALRAYLTDKKVKRITIPRITLRLHTPDDMTEILSFIDKVASQEQRSRAYVIECALVAYLKLPENYLGEKKNGKS